MVAGQERLIVVLGMAHSGTTILTYVLKQHPDVILAVGGHDADRDVLGAGVFGLTGAARRGGVIRSDGAVAAGEGVVAVAAQRPLISAGMARPTRVDTLLGRQAGCRPPGGSRRLAR